MSGVRGQTNAAGGEAFEAALGWGMAPQKPGGGGPVLDLGPGGVREPGGASESTAVSAGVIAGGKRWTRVLNRWSTRPGTGLSSHAASSLLKRATGAGTREQEEGLDSSGAAHGWGGVLNLFRRKTILESMGSPVITGIT